MKTYRKFSGYLVVCLWAWFCVFVSDTPVQGNQFELLCIEGPPSTADAPEHWRAIAEAGFTLVTPGHPYDAAWQQTTLDRCAEFGLRAVPRVKIFEKGTLPDDWPARVTGAVAAYKGHRALYGYYVIDEPHAYRRDVGVCLQVHRYRLKGMEPWS